MVASLVADVARRADRHVEASVGAEGDELPAVRPVGRELVVDHHRFGRRLEVRLDVVVAQDAVDFRDVEIAVAEGDAVRHVEAAVERQHPVGLPVAVVVEHRVDVAEPAGADEERPVRAERQLPRVRHVGARRPRWRSRPAGSACRAADRRPGRRAARPRQPRARVRTGSGDSGCSWRDLGAPARPGAARMTVVRNDKGRARRNRARRPHDDALSGNRSKASQYRNRYWTFVKMARLVCCIIISEGNNWSSNPSPSMSP